VSFREYWNIVPSWKVIFLWAAKLSAFVYRWAARCRIWYLLFNQIADGAPALVNWLCAQGCWEAKYAFHAGLDLEESGEE
jgi:hypothetical protein